MEVLSKSLNLAEFEDPINMEPFTNVVCCPHDPTHHYQFGTMSKKMIKGEEYTQCALTNEWFPSSKFKKDPYDTEASIRIHEINKVYLKEKETNLILQNKNKELKNEAINLTDKINTLIKQNENLNKNNENLTDKINMLINDNKNLTIKNESLKDKHKNIN